MSEQKASPFRRKWRCKAVRQAPFPVPIASRIGHPVQSSEWPLYKGRLLGKSVLVEDSEHVKALQQGFFGHSNQPRRSPRNGASTKASLSSNSKEVGVNDVVNNPSRLSLEEAFFLSFGLGCLIVTENDQMMNLEEMRNRYQQLDSSFGHRYAVYHHYRSLGWVVKSGIKFGVDYILYKEGPPFYHASYSVQIIFKNNSGEEQNSPSWSSLAGLNRLCERVAKELVLCYVSEAQQTDAKEQTMNEQIFRFQIEEILVNRWVSTEDRKVDDDV